jgi:hypothetical protein
MCTSARNGLTTSNAGPWDVSTLLRFTSSRQHCACMMQTLGLPPLWAGSLGPSDVNGAKRKTVHKGLYSLAPFSQCSPLACILTVMRTLTPTSRLGLPASPGPWRVPSGNGSDPQSRLHNPQAKGLSTYGLPAVVPLNLLKVFCGQSWSPTYTTHLAGMSLGSWHFEAFLLEVVHRESGELSGSGLFICFQRWHVRFLVGFILIYLAPQPFLRLVIG